ncbi:alpha-glucosidase [Enterococcus phoeniculicola]|jgi:glucan 1,6-alpha-glucosidase|uniref:Glucan 1,6-alpha-glucosidase n=3 Tax=Enterococcus phoeniculicola TaxID=154621 RepID=R3TSI7_9ENTE|nr:alpha-glucosidase [Enterococcus phoeniculicola]EOL44118.1 glucan 1,6-alpha-glucosidase [Enterococcus phoeniculicola ATCC BAA-412]EOT75220.1 glucan 1,6-alpha-glucosidase [Enterococcus phoeniculicola ATCC BAA-412]
MKWWQDKVIYQIYPRSFNDSNGDGIGDLKGIIEKIDYLSELGVGAIWLCPVYQSPNKDNGYDISDYQEIQSLFGTMEDLELLIEKAREKNIYLLMDLVVNHTSDQHPWFIEARKNKENDYRAFYIWRDGDEGEVPNTLSSVFSGSAWTYDSPSSQYYLHLFTKEQPDLNWKHKEMREKIYQMMNFWAEKGIGGFRLDVIDLIGKEPDLEITANGPLLHDYVHEMNQNVFSKYEDMLTVGETWGATPEIGKQFSDPAREELSMIFQFEHMMLDQQEGKDSSNKWALKPLEISQLKAVMSKWQTALGNIGWNSLFWNNHDLPRIVSRWGDDQTYWMESAKLFAILLHFMKGTPFVYQGEEIGMTNIVVSNIDQVDDIESRNMYFDRINKGYSKEQLLHAINVKGRDNARTPMQWNGSVHAGFSSGQPWLCVNDNYETINVENQLHDPASILSTYRQLIHYRKNNELIVFGEYELLYTEEEVFSYLRYNDTEAILVVTNLSEKAHRFVYPKNLVLKEQIISNYPNQEIYAEQIELKPYMAYAVKVAIQKKC